MVWFIESYGRVDLLPMMGFGVALFLWYIIIVAQKSDLYISKQSGLIINNYGERRFIISLLWMFAVVCKHILTVLY